MCALWVQQTAQFRLAVPVAILLPLLEQQRVATTAFQCAALYRVVNEVPCMSEACAPTIILGMQD